MRENRGDPVTQKWRHRFLQLAAHVAEWSKDPSTKVGAVIVDHQRLVVGIGYNGFPRGVVDDDERYAEKSVKYRMVVHAEQNAIFNAARSVHDMTLFATKFPCSECAKAIIQNGIYHVISPAPATEGVWGEDAHFSTQMLREAAVIVDLWPESIL